MEQKILPESNQSIIPPSSNNKNLLTFIVSVVVTVLVVGAGVYFFLNKASKQPKSNNPLPSETIQNKAPKQPESNNLLPSGTIQNQATSTASKKIYFGKGSQGKYSLINVQTGEAQDFIPFGYTLLDQFDYQMFPTFLILQKDNDLYSYNVENKIANSIFGSFNDLKLKKNEQARIYPSMTEKDKFIIRIDTLDLSQVSEFDGSSPTLSTRTYSFDASTNKLVAMSSVKFDGCAKYDSKNQRFFTWPCGEGIGSASPLSISDLNGNLKSQVITAKDFGVPNDDLVHIEFNNGIFFALGKGKDIKILVVNPALENPSKELYVATVQVNSQISEPYAYSMGIDRNTKTLIIGGNNYILLFRFDTNKQITQSTYIPDKELYANFIFPNEGKLYYQAKDGIRMVNLNSWQIEKIIPSSSNFSEITLFAF